MSLKKAVWPENLQNNAETRRDPDNCQAPQQVATARSSRLTVTACTSAKLRAAFPVRTSRTRWFQPEPFVALHIESGPEFRAPPTTIGRHECRRSRARDFVPSFLVLVFCFQTFPLFLDRPEKPPHLTAVGPIESGGRVVGGRERFKAVAHAVGSPALVEVWIAYSLPVFSTTENFRRRQTPPRVAQKHE